MDRMQVAGQEFVNFQADLLGQFGVDAVETVPARSFLEYFILKFLALGLQGLDQMFHFD